MRKVLVLLALALAMYVGYRLGIRHVIYHAEIWTDEYSYLSIDGEVYEYE